MALSAGRNRVIVAATVVGVLGLGGVAFVLGDDGGPGSTEAAEEEAEPTVTALPVPPFVYGPGGFPVCDVGPPVGAGEETVILSSGNIGGSPGCEPLESLFRREAGPVVVRAYLTQELEDPAECAAGGCVPRECRPHRNVVAELSTKEAVGAAFGSLYRGLPEPILVTSGVFGVAEGAPVAWAIVQVDREIAQVRVRFAAGGEDAMKPEDGVAVVTSPVRQGDAETPAPWGGTVEALDGAGNVTATMELTPGLPVEQRVFELPECAPRPQELPEPDGPPPENETEARQDVVDAFTIAFGGPSTPEERLARIDDPHDLEGTREQVRRNFPEAPLDEVSVRVEELRFLNQTTAAVRYTIVLPGYSIPEFPNRIGRAVLIDGVWKVTRETVCRSLELGGVTCPP